MYLIFAYFSLILNYTGAHWPKIHREAIFFDPCLTHMDLTQVANMVEKTVSFASL